MRFLFTSDLHGEIRLYEELYCYANELSVEIIALGGDLLPLYSYDDIIPNQRMFVREFFSSWLRKITKETSVKTIVFIPGNWDLGYRYIFDESTENVADLAGRSMRIGNGFELIGYPFVPPTPFKPKEYEKIDVPGASIPPQKYPSYCISRKNRDRLEAIDPVPYLMKRGTIREDLEHLPSSPEQRKTVYVMHSPPHGTRLDLIHGGSHIGSRAIRSFIERKQPYLTLHGHVHESPLISGSFVERIGSTIAVNPGQSSLINKDGRGLDAVIFDLEDVNATIRHVRF